MKNKIIRGLFCIIGMCTLFSCSADISGGTGANTDPVFKPNETFMDDRATIAGPEWIGTWTSNCNQKSENIFRRWVFDVTSSKIVRKEITYLDKLCAQIKTEVQNNGRYRFIDQFNDGGWNVEYAFDLGNGVTSFPQEKIIVEADKIYISNFVLAEEGMMLASEPLFKNTLANPPVDHPPVQDPPILEPILTPVPSHSPKLGDMAKYEGKNLSQNQIEVYTTQGYNIDYKDWTVFQEITGPYPKMGYIYLNDLWSTEKFKDLIKNCVQNGNTLETIKVKAGTFETCKVISDGKIKWYGNIPVLGLVKIQYLNGSYKSELSQFAISQ